MKLFLSFMSAVILLVGVVPFASAVESANPSVKSQTSVNQEAININTADIEALTKLKGVGVKKAEAIIAWREANGNFKSVDQLLDVKGIGEATLEANRKNISI